MRSMTRRGWCGPPIRAVARISQNACSLNAPQSAWLVSFLAIFRRSFQHVPCSLYTPLLICYDLNLGLNFAESDLPTSNIYIHHGPLRANKRDIKGYRTLGTLRCLALLSWRVVGLSLVLLSNREISRPKTCCVNKMV
jgi:hypothetical protein